MSPTRRTASYTPSSRRSTPVEFKPSNTGAPPMKRLSAFTLVMLSKSYRRFGPKGELMNRYSAVGSKLMPVMGAPAEYVASCVASTTSRSTAIVSVPPASLMSSSLTLPAEASQAASASPSAFASTGRKPPSATSTPTMSVSSSPCSHASTSRSRTSVPPEPSVTSSQKAPEPPHTGPPTGSSHRNRLAAPPKRAR